MQTNTDLKNVVKNSVRVDPVNYTKHACQLLVFLMVFLAISMQDSLADDQKQTFLLDLNSAVGEKVYYRIHKTSVMEGNTRPGNINAVIDVAIEYRGQQSDGNVYAFSYLDFEIDDSAENNDPLVRETLALYTGLTFEYLADEGGIPKAVRDVDYVRESILQPSMDVLKHETKDSTVVDHVAQFFSQLEPEGLAEVLLRDIDPVFEFAGSELTLGERYENDQTFPWHLTGTDLDMSVTTKALSVDDGIVTIQSDQTLIPESLEAGLMAFMDQLDVATSPEKRELMRLALKTLESFDIKTTVISKVSVSNGWPVEVKQIRTFDTGQDRGSSTLDIVQIANPTGSSLHDSEAK